MYSNVSFAQVARSWKKRAGVEVLSFFYPVIRWRRNGCQALFCEKCHHARHVGSGGNQQKPVVSDDFFDFLGLIFGVLGKMIQVNILPIHTQRDSRHFTIKFTVPVSL